MKYTGERFMPEVHGSIELEHRHRYLLACQLAAGKCVLDIASGEGYGSAMLANAAVKVTGVDISEEAVQHAQRTYQTHNLEFKVGSCAMIPMPTASVDIVVSFETIEHHDEHEAMMREIKRVLRPGGVLIISSPDKLEFTDRPNQHNPHHVKELYREEFKSLLGTHFTYHQIYGQKIIFGSAILCESGSTPSTSYEFSDNELLTSAGVPRAVYLVAVASDSHLPVLATGILEQQIADSDFTHFWQGLMAERDAQIVDLYHVIGNRDTSVASLNQTLLANDMRIEDLDRTVADRDQQIIQLHHTISEKLSDAERLSYSLAERELLLQQILQSHSWRYTKPLRFLNRLLAKLCRAARGSASNMARDLWRQFPLSPKNKQKFKNFCFRKLSIFFKRTMAFGAWQNLDSLLLSDSRHNGQGTVGSIAQEKISYVPLLHGMPLQNKPAKLICFYLPQFHPIPENNEWWGEGFTEWTNVRPAQPQFENHYQPHVPGELGYYNLLDPTVQRRQVELAKLYGIEGFCFYFYWFGGKRLLDTPTQNYLHDSNLDLPFCLCWANENWSRRWDGLDSEILIAQQNSPEDDLAFIQHVAQYMRDARYIRIDGKPLLLVYRPSLLPSAKETAKRWRRWCTANGIGDIYLAYTQSFEQENPGRFGFDAAIEFPPNNSSPPNITDQVTPLVNEFGSTIYDWRVFVERSKKYQKPDYKLFRSVCTSWDNTARRKNRGTIFLNSTPELYQLWLANAVENTCKQFANPDERLVFINAWNEWAEGAHLEPDAAHGYAYLQATRDALIERGAKTIEEPQKIVLVTHDAHPHGAQFLALHLAKTLSRDLGFHVDLVCLGDGPLKSDFKKWAVVHDLSQEDVQGAKAIALCTELYKAGARSALVNTTVAGHFLKTLENNGFTCTALIHELEGVIAQFGLFEQAKAIAQFATKVVFPAEEVAASFNKTAPVDVSKTVIRPQGLYKRRSNVHHRTTHRESLRHRFGLSEDNLIVLGVGFADHRKGIDLFVEAGLKMAQRVPKARWMWIGHWEKNMQREIEKNLAASTALRDIFIFPGLQTDTDLFYGGSDIFALTSREDPFPSVVLEALDAELPVVGFEGAGGFINLLREGCGRLVEKENVEAFANAVADLLMVPHEREVSGKRGTELIKQNFSFRHYAFDLLDYAEQSIPRISVIVPNFNYARYITERLSSIYNQSCPIFEIIFLDDCSTDASVDIAKALLATQPIDYRIVVNEENSGSVFKQWKKGVDLARGTHVWIAEADDYANVDFLREVMKGFETDDVTLSYCESKQIDANGKLLANNYLDYVADIGAERWKQPFIRLGRDEIAQALSIKNTIPNVSGVVFDRDRLKTTLDANIDLISTYRIAGDWLVYVLTLAEGKIAFSPACLNMHRRHERGVTIGSFNKLQLDEIENMQAFVAKEFDVQHSESHIARKYIDHLAQQFSLTTL